MRFVFPSCCCVAALAVAALPAAARELRFCADPNNLPYSDRYGEGFENRIAELLATDLGAHAVFVWAPQWRGFLRKTLDAGLCDAVMGVAAGLERVRTTAPYYRSTYVFVQPADQPRISSFDDPALRSARIGVQLIGDDGVNTPPVEELSRRGLHARLHGYMVYGDISQPYPQSPVVDAVAKGDVDVAIAWGPGASYFAASQVMALQVTAVDETDASVPMTFAMAIGVRKADAELAAELQQALDRRRDEIAAILDGYHVPRSPDRPDTIRTGNRP